jgi:hypothetical protein
MLHNKSIEMRKVLFLIAVLIPAFCQAQVSQFFSLNQNFDPIPQYFDNGGIITGANSSISVPLPTGIKENDIIIIHASNKSTSGFNSIATYTALTERTDPNLSHNIWWKRANGTETGTVTVIATLAGQDIGGVAYVYRNSSSTSDMYNTSTAVALEAVNRGSSITGNIINDLGIEFWCLNENNASPSGGGSGWVLDANVNTTNDTGFTFIVSSYIFTTAGASTVPSYPTNNAYIGLAELVLSHK